MLLALFFPFCCTQCNEEKVTNIRTQFQCFFFSSFFCALLVFNNKRMKREKKNVAQKRDFFFVVSEPRIGRCCVSAYTFFWIFMQKFAINFLLLLLSSFAHYCCISLHLNLGCDAKQIVIVYKKKNKLKVFLCCRFLFHWLFRSAYAGNFLPLVSSCSHSTRNFNHRLICLSKNIFFFFFFFYLSHSIFIQQEKK